MDNYTPQLRNSQGHLQIFDPLRKRWVACTPEERVRQHFVHYLINILQYPAGRIGNEVGITLNNTARRCDTLIYDDSALPLAIVEYKAPEVSITRTVFDQILRYALALNAPWLIVSNGRHTVCARAIPGTPPRLQFTDHLPTYPEMLHQPT